MATNAVVTYVLDIKGNFTKQLDSAKASLTDMARVWGDTAKKVNQNQIVSQIESLASILTQFGGSVSQIGIITSTAIRPLYTLSGVFGASAPAAAAATAAIGLLAIGMVKAVGSTKEWIGEMVKLRQELVDQGWLSSSDARNLVEYGRSIDRAAVSTEKLKVNLADKLAPAFQELTDASTGFVRILGDLDTTGESARGSISNLINTLGTSVGGTLGVQLEGIAAAMKGLSAYGQDENAQSFDRFNPLLAPFAPGIQFTDLEGRGFKYDTTFIGPTKEQDEIGGEIVRQREKDKREAAAKARKAESDLMEEISRALAMNEKEKDLIDQRVKAQIAINDNLLQGYYEGIEFQKETDAIIKRMEKETDAFERDYAASDKIKMDSGLSGVVSSASGGAVNLGPIGIVVGLFNSLVDELFNLPDLLNTTIDNGLRVFLELPDLIFDIAGLIIPKFIRAIPEFISGFILLAPAIIWELIKAAPIILSSVFEAILQLPYEFVKQAMDAFKISEFLDILKGIAQIWKNPGHMMGIDLKGDDKKLFGIKLPSFDTGGMVQRTGLAYVHAGERVLNRQETRNYSGGNVGVVNIYGATDLRRLSEQVQRSTGRYGIGLSLNPYVGG